jgi:hypothetical protein
LALGPEILERDLERSLIENIRALILELGKGFAFVGSQYHLEVGGQDYYLDLLFYHLRLRCFVVIDLKIEDFKPEFAGKMNFYLSAIDSRLRHANDAPTIGIILCKQRNEMIVEYALRGTAKPMSVARYVVSDALPAPLEKELPTAAELAREMPFLSLLKLRMEIERSLRTLIASRDISSPHPGNLGAMLRNLERNGIRIPVDMELRDAIDSMNSAIHGQELSAEDAEEAERIGNAFLSEIRKLETAE